MAFPYTSYESFELGTLGNFDAESDTNSKLDFPHYSELARTPGLAMPYRGSNCMRVDLAGGTGAAYVQETGDWDLSATNTLYFRFMFWFGGSPVMASDDVFGIWQLWSATNTVEATCFVEYTTATGYRLGINETAAAASASFLPLTLNEWHSVELAVTIDDGVSNDGTIDMWLDGGAATQITGLDQGAITSGVLGTVGIDAGTTAGTCLFDEVIADDARVYGPDRRFQDEVMMFESGHAFVGPGKIKNITLLSGAGTDNVLVVHDTDNANTNDVGRTVVELKNTANNETVDPAGVPVDVSRGAYVSLTGTNPRALVQIGRAVAYGSDGAIRNYGLRRRNV